MKKPPSKPKPRFINPPNKLKAKVGIGGIDTKLLDEAQDYLKSVDVDFKPTAEQLLEKLQTALKDYKQKNSEEERLQARDDIARAIMQLKANGTMFGHPLISEIAALGLNFIDNLEELNEEAFLVLDVHSKTLQMIISSKLKGDGGAEGRALVRELEKACSRYFEKYTPKV